ncbi:MAG: outer membrane protein assembly factor BamB [Steroidobacteraceae bacterium]
MSKLKFLPAAGLCGLAWLAGCSTDKADRPVVLVSLVNHIQIKEIWHTRVRGEAPKLRLGLDVAVDGNRVFAASYKGTVVAFDRSNGRRLWQRELRAPLSGGPSAADGLVVIGTSKGEVIALAQQDGALRWRVRVNAEILAAPAIGGGLVAVRGVDGKLFGLAQADGHENWLVDQQVPRLSLRGTSRPLLVGDLTICGFDNGRLLAVTRGSGATAWDVAVAQPHGNTELRRLIDIDASVQADGDDLFAIAYQGRVARIVRESGQIVWARDLSSYRGLAVDAKAVYVTTAEGDVVSLDRQSGTEQWRQKGLERRQLSAPVVYGGRVVVADYSGLVHWLDAASGAFVARARNGKQHVSSAPIVAGDLLLVFGDDGDLSAFRTPPAAASATGG